MSLRVLIAEPDWRFARQATRYLEAHAHLVVNQSTPQTALACARHWQPDLVILAAELADKHGLMEGLYRIRPRPAVLLTDHMSRYDRAWRAWQSGGDGLLMKPVFNVRELQDAIVVALENGAAGAVSRPATAAASA
jgi:DNA-binding response OmpR family regulator